MNHTYLNTTEHERLSDVYTCPACGKAKYTTRPKDQFLFTQSELRTIYLLLENMSNKEIAHTCNIQEKSVKFHLTNIFKKTNVVCRSEFKHLCRQFPKIIEPGFKRLDSWGEPRG